MAFMPVHRTFALLAAAPALVAAQQSPAPDGPMLDGVELAQVTVRERMIIRVRPARRVRGGPASAPPPVWSERRARRCVPVEALAGVGVSRGGDVDLMLVDGRRLRAKLGEDCPTLSFYGGFYLRPGRDGQLCGGRDVLRARSGAACPILRFRMLEARR
jgi:hypothetical protein